MSGRSAYATHLPVLALAIAVWRPARIVEFGTGGYSTNAFLDRGVLPWVESLVSFEDNREWFEITEGTLGANPRFPVRYVESSIRNAATRDQLAGADL